MALPVRGDSADCTEITEGSAEIDFSSPTKGSVVQRDAPLRYSRAYEKALMRRVDRRLLPILGALYAVSLVDRVNVCSLNFLMIWFAWAKFDRYPTPELRAWTKIWGLTKETDTPSRWSYSSFPIFYSR